MGRKKKNRTCPRCASKDVLLQDSFEDGVNLYVCADCDHEFEVGGYGSKRRSEEFENDHNSDSEVMENEE